MSDRLPLNRREILAGAAAVAALAPLSVAFAADSPAQLELVATFTSPHQVTGVAVAPSGRIFVNFPRWEEDVAISVAEVGPNGALTPFPDAAWNAFRNAADPKAPGAAEPGTSFVCVQSVTVDMQGRLWVLDPAAPGLAFEVAGGPKLVCIDLSTNKVTRVIHFGTDIAPQGSYLNDIRFTPDGHRAVLTNSGTPGSLITLDLRTGQARSVLVNHPSTQFDPAVTITVSGKPLRMLDGQPAHFSADGIAVVEGGKTVRWQSTTGTTMYEAALADLFDHALTPAQLGAKVKVAAKTFVTDGYWFSPKSGLYLTSAEEFSVKRMNPDGSFTVVAHDPRLLWPDSMAEDAQGRLYVTASHIPEMKAWQGPGISQTQLFRFRPA